MIQITPTFHINEHELQIDFVRAAGPGGQNVNKVATAVQLRFNVRASKLHEDAKVRLLKLAGQRATTEGEILIEAKRFRTQEQNRADALERLMELLRRSLVKPKPRKKTKPSAASKEKRLKAKRVKGEHKRLRSAPIERD
ncbi:MAG TPA: alternative ribosome rescue aminoacyl-tRNA hydrolase ArfB [Anaerolineales bacterium]|nr:alternative ribosome rescue aminoacyl-tRNA hydrolase ArfB [Anaerolineales bacterium]